MSIVESEPMPAHGARAGRGSRGMAVLGLAVCCVFWGYSFPAMQMLSGAWDRAAGGQMRGAAAALALRATFLGWRFALAAGLYFLLTHPRQRGHSANDWRAGLSVGGFMSLGMMLQIVGLRYTLPSVSAFITALTIVFAPLGQSLFLRERVGGRIWLAVGVAFAGTVLLSAPNSSAVAAKTLVERPPLPYLGEVLTGLGAVIFTCQIIAVDRLAPRADVARLTMIMLATVAVAHTTFGATLAGGGIYRPGVLELLVTDRTFLWVMPTLIVFSTVGSLHLMNIFQPRISPAAACVVYCLEPVFATAFSVIMRTELLTGITAAGGAVVLCAVLIVARAERADKRLTACSPGPSSAGSHRAGS